MSLIIIVLSVVLVGVKCQNWTDTRVVQTDQGLVRGFKYIGEDFFSFYNIPYASVTHRYLEPAPPPTWTETFDAVNRKIVCAQPEADFIDIRGYTMLEDCLVMNIFLPDTNKRNLPVLVNIHGGAYFAGYADAHRYTQFAVQKNVIIVTFNFRVAMFGLLCLGTKNIPGNAGFKDAIYALRWVKRNIANFGGNPDDVTVTGCSSGGSVLDLLLLSKASEGLFNKAIPDSGANLGAFAVALDPIELAKERAKELNFHDVDNIEALEEFYLVTPFEKLIVRSPSVRPNTLLDYAPCVERDVGQELIILDDAPYNILKNGNYTKYPTLYGLTNLEGLNSLRTFDEWSVGMNENFGNYLPGDLTFANDTQRREVGERVKRFFFGDSPVNLNTQMKYLDYYSDTLFINGILRNVKLQVEAGHNQIYLYIYWYYAEGARFEGGQHCGQAHAVRDDDENTITEEYRTIKLFMRDVWYNFMRTGSPVVAGSPVPSWPPLNQPNRSPHLSVGRNISLQGPLLEERANFWDSIYEQYYRIPSPPTIPDASTDNAASITISHLLVVSIFVMRYLV